MVNSYACKMMLETLIIILLIIVHKNKLIAKAIATLMSCDMLMNNVFSTCILANKIVMK